MGCFLKGQDHTGLNIMALAGYIGGAGGRTAAKAAESTAKAAAKDIAKDVAQVHAAKTTAHMIHTKSIAHSPFNATMQKRPPETRGLFII